MPLQRRIPKRGFTPRKRTVYQIVNVGDLARVDGATVNVQTLSDAGLINSGKGLIKVLAMGELSQSYSVEAHKFSAGAVAKIEAAGGSVTVVGPSERDASGTPDEPATLAAPEEPTASADASTTSDEPATSDDSDEEPPAWAESDEAVTSDEPADQKDAENDG